MDLGWSTPWFPVILGAISLITRSARHLRTHRRSCSRTASSVKVALDEVDSGQCVHWQQVERDDSRTSFELGRHVLAPAARCRAQIDAGHSGLQESFLLIDLLQLENGPRSPALAPCLLHVRVAFLAFAPAPPVLRGLLTPVQVAQLAHAVHSRPWNLAEPQKKYLRGLGHQLKPVIMVGDAGLSESVAEGI